MSVPTGKVIDRPMVTRGCGCQMPFEVYDRDRFREARLAKFQSTRCPACAAKFTEEQKQAAAAVMPAGDALRALPPGTTVTLKLAAGPLWSATLVAEGVTTEAAGPVGAGPHAAAAAAARKWLKAKNPNG